MILPSYSNFKFYERSNFKYVYNMPKYLDMNEESYDYIKETEGVSILFSNIHLNANLSKQDIEKHSFYANKIKDNLYITTNEKNLEKTFFTSKNFIGKNIKREDNTIYITYGTAKALDIKKGDMITINFPVFQENHMKDKTMIFTLVGYLKPLYPSLSLSYDQNEGFTSLAFVSDEDYKCLKDSGVDIFHYFFTDLEQDSVLQDFVTSREKLKESVTTYLNKPATKNQIAIALISVIISIIILIYLEFSFTRIKNRKEIEVLSKLGMPTKSIRQIYRTNIFISYSITVIIALLISKFIYLDKMVAIYCDHHILLIILLGLLLVGFVMIFIQSLIIKRF